MKDRWEDWFDEGERLLWQGAPQPNGYHWPRNIGMALFGIPFLGGGLMIAATAVGSFAELTLSGIALGIFLAAFSTPFITAGAAMVFGPWLYDQLMPARTKYVLTNKAGYIATTYWNRTMDVFPVMADVRIEITEHRNGTATVYFHFEEKRDSDGDQMTTKKGFAEIAREDAHAVYRLVRALQSGERPDPI